MTDMTVKTPWHLWAIAVVAVFWNGFGGYDYVMTQTGNAAYLAQFTAEQRAYFDSYPMWMEAVWAIGVWGGVLGAVLLLLRNKLALPCLSDLLDRLRRQRGLRPDVGRFRPDGHDRDGIQRADLRAGADFRDVQPDDDPEGRPALRG